MAGSAAVSPAHPLYPIEAEVAQDAAMGAGAEEVMCSPCGEGEGTASKAMVAPVKPTKQMIADHEVSHLPFRSWCAACVRGRAKSHPHFKCQEREGELSTFSVDYGFFGSPGETPVQAVSGKDLPVLVAYDRKSKTIFAHPVPHKGLEKDGKVDEYPVRVLVKDLDRLGYKRVNGKSDQEPAILAVCNAVKAMWKGEWVPERAPRGESKSNGEVERAVQTIHGLARTLKEHLEQYARITIDPKSPILAWLIEHTANLHYLFNKGEDGMTPYQRVKGKEWQIQLPSFGESVEFKRRTRHKLEARWERGLFLGVQVHTTEKIVGTKAGVLVVQSIRRVPEDERYDSEALGSLRGLPWKPTPDGPDDQGAMELPSAVEMQPDCPEVPAVPVESADQQKAVRKYYITAADLEKYGFTDHCPACIATATNLPRSGVQHTHVCRERIETAVRSDPRRSTRYDATRARLEERQRGEPEAVAGGMAASSSHAEAILAHPEAPPAKRRAFASSDAAEQEQETAMQDTGLKRKASQDGDQEMDLLAQLIGRCDEEFGLASAEGTENAIDRILEEHRERVLMGIGECGDEFPTANEKPYDWDAEDYIGPEDMCYRDDLSGKQLPEGLVQEARGEEIEFIDKIVLWDVVPRPAGVHVIDTRWVDVNKGDEKDFQVRSRVVAKEIKRKGSVEQYFAAMPPLASLKMLLSLATTARLQQP